VIPFFDDQAKQAATIGVRAKIMRSRTSLTVEIIGHANYAHPFPVHREPCLNRRAKHTAIADDVDESFIGRLLRKRLWILFRVMRQVNALRSASKGGEMRLGFCG